MSKIWFCSDWHFNHNKNFIYEPRGFKSIEEMNFNIIKRHNEVVNYDDIVYCLGDCCLGDNLKGIHCMQQLNGQIKIVCGNHCTDERIKLYKQYGFEVLGFAYRMRINGLSFYLSHYPSCTSNFDDDKPLKARTICLAGHTHSKEKWDETGSYNVALDAHNCYPVLLDDIIKDVKEKLKCK